MVRIFLGLLLIQSFKYNVLVTLIFTSKKYHLSRLPSKLLNNYKKNVAFVLEFITFLEVVLLVIFYYYLLINFFHFLGPNSHSITKLINKF